MHDSRHGRRTQTVFYSLTTARPPPACLTCALRRSRSLARWPSSPLPSSRPTQAFTHSLTCFSRSAHLPFFSHSVGLSFSSLSLCIESPYHDPPPRPLVHRDPVAVSSLSSPSSLAQDLLPGYVFSLEQALFHIMLPLYDSMTQKKRYNNKLPSISWFTPFPSCFFNPSQFQRLSSR